MTTVREILEEVDDVRLERAVWRQLEEVLTELIPSDVEEQPKHAIRVEGTDRVVPPGMVERVLAEIRGKVGGFNKRIESLENRNLEEASARRKAPRKAPAKKARRSKKVGKPKGR